VHGPARRPLFQVAAGDLLLDDLAVAGENRERAAAFLGGDGLDQVPRRVEAIATRFQEA
jgi:hypothetical protein